MGTEKNCLICNKSDFTLLHSIREKMYGEKFRIMQCKNCGFIFTLPQLPTEELLRFYPDDYYSFIPRQSISSLPERRSIKKRISNELKILLLEEVYNYEFKIRNFPSSFLRIFLPIYRYFAQEVYPRSKSGGRILDIGCGWGEYLLKLRNLGWEVYGVELNRYAARIGQERFNLNIFPGEVSNAQYPDCFFDAVTLHHTLEHVSAPWSVIEEAHRVLKDGGELIVSVPNVENWERRLFGKFWWGWDIPRHLWHFSSASLERFLREAGFKKKKVLYIADMYDFPENIRNMLNKMFLTHKSKIDCLFNRDKLRFITKYILLPIEIISALVGISEKFVIFTEKESDGKFLRTGI